MTPGANTTNDAQKSGRLSVKGLESPTFSVRRWTRSSVIGSSSVGALVIVLALIPFMVSLGSTTQLTTIFPMLILAMTWNLLAGFGGMVSIGQQAYIGIGAYGMVVLADQLGINLYIAVFLAAGVGAVLGFLISFLAFRLVGGYFAVGTWVIAEVVRLIVVQFPQIGGGSGIAFNAMTDMFEEKSLRIGMSYWLSLAVAVIVLLVCIWFVRSRIGLALTAVRDDVTAASTSGVRVQSIRRRVFVFAAAAAAAAGALIAINANYVQPTSVFSVTWSAYMIFIVVVGGVGTLEGPIIGTIIYWALGQLLADFGTLYLILLGVLGIVFVLFVRGGVWGLVSRKGRVELFPVGYVYKQSEPQ